MSKFGLEGSRGLIIGAIGALVIAAGAIAAWEVATGEEEAEEGRSLESILDERPEDEEGGFFPSEPESGDEESSASLPDFERYSSPKGGWSAEIPTGGGWSAPSEEEPTPGQLFRTSLDGPNGAILIIDSTPSERPAFERDTISRTEISHPEFGSAEEVVFTGDSPIDECNEGQCVDYLLTDGPGGYAVLGGGADLDYARAVAGHVAATLRAR